METLKKCCSRLAESYGKLMDKYGDKKVIVITIFVLFLVGSIISGAF